MASRTRCRRCGEPRSTSYVGSSCSICEYEDTTGHKLERIAGRPVLEDAELLKLLYLRPEGWHPRGPKARTDAAYRAAMRTTAGGNAA